MELPLVLATILQRAVLVPSDTSDLEFFPTASLRPAKPLLVEVRRRQASVPVP